MRDWPLKSGIGKSLFSTQQRHLDKLTVLVYKKILHIPCIKAIYHNNQVEKTKQNKIYLIGSCFNRRNTQQSYVNSVMTHGNKPVIQHINEPVRIINTVRLTWVKSEKKLWGWHLSESSTNKKFWNWICNPLEFHSYGYGSMSIDSIVQEPKARRQLWEIIRSQIPISIAKPHCINSLRPSDEICVSKFSILGSDNSLSPGRRQAII